MGKHGHAPDGFPPRLCAAQALRMQCALRLMRQCAPRNAGKDASQCFCSAETQNIREKGFENVKATGIVHRIDDLGRVVIPKEIRRTMRIREGDPLLITLEPWERFCFGMMELAKRQGLGSYIKVEIRRRTVCIHRDGDLGKTTILKDSPQIAVAILSVKVYENTKHLRTCFQILIDSLCFILYNCFTKVVKAVILVKKDFNESQYAQLAIEQFCRVINQVPFVSDIEVRRTGFQSGYGDYIVSVHFSDNDEIQKFGIEVKSNGEKRFANIFMLVASQHKEFCCVFMAPYISDATATLLKSFGYSYMDLSGNCYVLTRRIILSVSGQPNQYIEKRARKGYFLKSSTAVSSVLRVMLSRPEQMWQVKHLAQQSGKAMGTVSNVKSFLAERDWLEEKDGLFRICNVKELLYNWAKDYHKKDTLSYEYYSLDKLPDIERQISIWSGLHDKSALLGGFCAGARYAPTVRYNRVDVYVEHQYLMEFVADLELQPVKSGGNVIVTIPHDETPCMDHRRINGDIVVSPVQTILDLLGNAGRGEEAADAVISKEFGDR